MVHRLVKAVVTCPLRGSGGGFSLLLQKCNDLFLFILGDQRPALHMHADRLPLLRGKGGWRGCIVAALTVLRPQLGAALGCNCLGCLTAVQHKDQQECKPGDTYA